MQSDGTDTGACETVDADGDGYRACPGVAATEGQDCDDTNDQVHPFAAERCDDIDDDCDGLVDADDPDDIDEVVQYVDADLDLWGDTLIGTACPSGEGRGVAYASGDCDDDDATIHPGADEVCDGIDNDCDTLIDTDDPDADCPG